MQPRIYALLTAAGAASIICSSAASAQCVGSCGTLGANGVVTVSPLGGTYQYVSTNGGQNGVGSLGVGSERDGSTLTSASFTAAAGDELEFYFNYITSDGSGFADYGYSQLINLGNSTSATLFTARTRPVGAGNVVPGFGLPGLLATLEPATTPIIPGGPVWAPLGSDSGACFQGATNGCGYTGWIKSSYTIETAGTYSLLFAVTNWSDTAFDSGLAFDGITVAGVPVDGVPEPATWALMITGFGLVGNAMRHRRPAVA